MRMNVVAAGHRSLPPGSELFQVGNIDSRVTDEVVLHVYALKLSVNVSHAFVSIYVCVRLLAFV